MRTFTALALCSTIAIGVNPNVSIAAAASKTLPEGTRIYMRLDQAVSGKRGAAEPGDVVQCEVWRDVNLQGVLLIKAGTHGICKVESVKHANIAGIKGRIVLDAMETKAVDGQSIQLTGGYNKQGKSRMALSISLGAVVLWPLIFITGSAAELPEGTVFDAYSGPDTPVAVSGQELAVEHPVINIGGSASPITADVILDDFTKPGAAPQVFRINITTSGGSPQRFVIDNVNDKAVEPIPLTIISTGSSGDAQTYIATVGVKDLAKHFQKGINRFEVSYVTNGHRTSSEVILNIQM